MSLNETTRDVLSIVVRLCGLMLLFSGLWIAIQVFNEALSLYKDPTNIERIAIAIEEGSNIDKSIKPIRDSIINAVETEGDYTETETKKSTATNGSESVRLSYFIAWVVDLLLLLLLARIAIMAIKTGGELTLYDAQIKKFARQLMKNTNQE